MNDYREIGFTKWGKECGLCKNTVGLEVHHVSGNHGDNAVENLMPLCGTCHNLVTVKLIDIDPRTREPLINVSGVFERGARTPTPPKRTELQIVAFREGLPQIWEVGQARSLLLLHDGVSKAFYVECHIPAKELVANIDFDTLIDPQTQDTDEELEQYRFNRELNESSDVFQRLVADAAAGRPFADLIVEWNTEYSTERPLKVIGGQHRGHAIQRAVDEGNEADRLHGLRVYFDLTVNQRVELVVVANSNIAIPNPLLDRIAEHQLGGESRRWCQAVGLLEEDEDFTDRVASDSRVTVQVMRSFITNYIKGLEFDRDADKDLFEGIVIPKTGNFEPDKEYSEALKRHPGIWSDELLAEAGRAFANLNQAQVTACLESSDPELRKVAFRYKALQPTVAAGWAFVAGMLRTTPDRRSLLFRLPENYDRRTSKDPLNAVAMSRSRYHSDPATYRGLGTRQNPAEGQKLAELFRLVADPQYANHVTSDNIKAGVTAYHKKKAIADADEAGRVAKSVRAQIEPS